MTIQTAFTGARMVFLDTSPAIYFISDRSLYDAVTVGAFAHCTASGIRLVASPVTLAESLAGETELPRQLTCYEYLTSPDIQMAGIDAQVGEVAEISDATPDLNSPTASNSPPLLSRDATPSSPTTPHSRRRRSP